MDDAKCIVVTRVCVCVCVCVCVSVCPRPHAHIIHCTDPDVTWRSGRGCPLVVHYWADLQSADGLRCYGNITRTRNFNEYMLVLALCYSFSVLPQNSLGSEKHSGKRHGSLRKGWVHSAIITACAVHCIKVQPVLFHPRTPGSWGLMLTYSRLTSVSTQLGGRPTIVFCGNVSSTLRHSIRGTPLKKKKKKKCYFQLSLLSSVRQNRGKIV